MTETAPNLLLLIPAYNEEQRIEPVLRDYAQYFQNNYPGKFSLVVVLNGCIDDTLGVVRRVGLDFPCVTAQEFPDPIGKGGALIEGLRLRRWPTWSVTWTPTARLHRHRFTIW